jgi:hypothetical protein
MRWTREGARIGGTKNAHKILVEEPLERRRWEDNIERELSCKDSRWVEPAHDRVQWRTSVLATLDLWVLLPPSYLFIYLVNVYRTRKDYETDFSLCPLFSFEIMINHQLFHMNVKRGLSLS